MDALLPDKNRYHLQEERVNFSSRAALIHFFSNTDFSGYDVLAIIRGGGTGLYVFDDVEVCKTIIATGKPLITAIGHAEDKPLLQKVADLAIATPSALGSYLQNLVIEDRQFKKELKQKDEIIAEGLKSHASEMQTLQHNYNAILAKQKVQLHMRNRIIGVLLLVMIVLGYFMFKNQR